MPYDGFVTHFIKEELSVLLKGKTDKIYQPDRDSIILHMRGAGTNYKLLLSSNAILARTHLTTANFDNPKKPFNFCMVLRKYLTGGRLIDITQISNDRILKFAFETSNELGDKEIKILIIEMMGKYSNIIFVNSQNIIIDSIKHVDFETSSVREVMPGRAYRIPPSQDKLNFFETDKNNFNDLYKNSNLSISKFLSSAFLGMSMPFAKWIESNYSNDLYNFLHNVVNSKLVPCVSLENSNVKDFYFIPLSASYSKNFETLSDAIDFFTKNSLEKGNLDNEKRTLLIVISASLSKAEKKLSIVNEKLNIAEEAEDLRIKGEILSANLYKVPSNVPEITLDNYYTGTPITITLDSNLSPSDNLKKIFKKYNKLKNTHIACSTQKEELLINIAYLESLFFEVDSLTDISDIDEIRIELASAGYIKKSSKKEKNEIKSQPLKTLFEGFEILTGKNNIQNDKLTFKIASKSDIWLHVKNAPGSHTIIHTNNLEVPESVLLKAASITAFHSKLKNSPKVEIDYTTVKNVKKIPGAKPGMVIYNNFKTLYVVPSA